MLEKNWDTIEKIGILGKGLGCWERDWDAGKGMRML